MVLEPSDHVNGGGGRAQGSRSGAPPFFSICIPQYNRTRFLEEAIRSVERQNEDSLEVCVSDDRSTDGGTDRIVELLQKTGRSFALRVQKRNRRYDGNLRSAVALARGRYCFLLGNDDALADVGVLSRFRAVLEAHDLPPVAIANYEEYDGQRTYRRVPRTGILGRGPECAVAHFRDFSFVGGVVLDRALAQRAASRAFDGSEMYQMYLGCRLLSEGGALLGWEESAVRKGIVLDGETVESYRDPAVADEDARRARSLPLTSFARTAALATSAGLPDRLARSVSASIARQVYRFTYPFWLVEYRRVKSFSFSWNLALGMAPRRSLRGVLLTPSGRAASWATWGGATILGLATPIRLFDSLRDSLYRLAKGPRTA